MKEYKTTIKRFEIKGNSTEFKKVKIGSSQDAADFCRNFYRDDIEVFESFFLLLLNNANNTIGYVKISQGGIVGTVVDVRILAKYAIESLATSVILCHNHPSGNMKPSQADINITEKVKQALNLFDIKTLDHIILSPEDNKYLSFGDDGLI